MCFFSHSLQETRLAFPILFKEHEKLGLLEISEIANHSHVSRDYAADALVHLPLDAIPPCFTRIVSMAKKDGHVRRQMNDSGDPWHVFPVQKHEKVNCDFVQYLCCRHLLASVVMYSDKIRRNKRFQRFELLGRPLAFPNDDIHSFHAKILSSIATIILENQTHWCPLHQIPLLSYFKCYRDTLSVMCVNA